MGHCVRLVLLSSFPCLLACLILSLSSCVSCDVSSRRLVLACRSRLLVVPSSCVLRRRLVVSFCVTPSSCVLLCFVSSCVSLCSCRVAGRLMRCWCEMEPRRPCDDRRRGDAVRRSRLACLSSVCPPGYDCRGCHASACLLACRGFLFDMVLDEMMRRGWGDRRENDESRPPRYHCRHGGTREQDPRLRYEAASLSLPPACLPSVRR